MMSRLLIMAGIIGGAAGYMLLGPEFREGHSMQEQIALGLLGILMICTLFGMKITTIFGVLFRLVVIALIWRCIEMVLRVVRLR